MQPLNRKTSSIKELDHALAGPDIFRWLGNLVADQCGIGTIQKSKRPGLVVRLPVHWAAGDITDCHSAEGACIELSVVRDASVSEPLLNSLRRENGQHKTCHDHK